MTSFIQLFEVLVLPIAFLEPLTVKEEKSLSGKSKQNADALSTANFKFLYTNIPWRKKLGIGHVL